MEGAKLHESFQLRVHETLEIYTIAFVWSGITHPYIKRYSIPNKGNQQKQIMQKLFNRILIFETVPQLKGRVDPMAPHDTTWKLIKYLMPGFKTCEGRVESKFTASGNTELRKRVFNIRQTHSQTREYSKNTYHVWVDVLKPHLINDVAASMF